MPSTTFDTTPEWYGGQEGILKEHMERGRNLYRSPYQQYKGERLAQFSPLQQQTFTAAENLAQNPFYPQTYGEATGAIKNALGQDVSPYINRAIGPTNIAEFYNPYQEQVIRNLEEEGARNLKENILPNINTRFIGAGQYGSTGHQDLTNRAIRDTQKAASQARANAQMGGFNTALQAALQKQGTNLQAGQLATKDIDRQMLGAEALQNLAGNQQLAELRNIGVLGQLGGQQQQQAQTARNIAYQEFQNEANYPYLQQARETEMIRGLPVSTQRIYSAENPAPIPQPQASPYTQMGGLLAGATGLFNQRPPGYAHGGMVKNLTKHRHYADGGSLSPIQQGANAAIDTAELKAMRDQATQLATPNIDPFWSSIARAGFNIAANRQPGVLAKLGEAGGVGMNEYQSQLAHQDQRGLQSANIMNLIDNTRRLQEERNRKHLLDLDRFKQHQKEFEMSHGLQQGHLGLAKERLALEKDLYEKGMKGTRGSPDNDLYKKSNQVALEEARKSISTLPTLKSNLNELKNLAEKLDTGPTKGKIARVSSTLGSLAGVGKAEDIDTFDSLTNSLVLDLGNQLKGSQVALGKLKIIEQSKPQLTKVKGGNVEIINHMKDLATLAEEKARFINRTIKSGGNAIEAEDAFNKYSDEKLLFEDQGKKFTLKPEDFFEDSPTSKSDEELMRIAGE